jgi:glycosyltransferase involved in cell wall biosynthesis
VIRSVYTCVTGGQHSERSRVEHGEERREHAGKDGDEASKVAHRIAEKAWYYGQRGLFRLRTLLPGWLRRVAKPLYRWAWRRASQRRVVELAGRNDCEERPLRGCRIVCFPVIDWEVRVERPQQLLSRLAARGATVYYLRNDFRARHSASLENLAPSVHGLRLTGPATLNIYRSTPPPTAVDMWLDDLGRNLGHLDGAQTVAFVQWPFWAPLAIAAARRWGWPIVYDCVDDHAAFPSAPPWIAGQERALVESSDLVVTTSRALRERWAGAAERCVHVPNAADFEHFHRPQRRQVLRSVDGKVVGYFGALAEWFDAPTVELAARRHPEWHFVLIGLNSGADLGRLGALPNVHLYGERRYDELPDYLHRFDAAIIPFRECQLAHGVDPVKFYEYLSAGVPVVASPLPELEPHRRLFYSAATADEFVKALERAVDEEDVGLAAERIEFARQNSWDHRVRQLETEVLALFARQPSRPPALQDNTATAAQAR